MCGSSHPTPAAAQRGTASSWVSVDVRVPAGYGRQRRRAPSARKEVPNPRPLDAALKELRCTPAAIAVHRLTAYREHHRISRHHRRVNDVTHSSPCPDSTIGSHSTSLLSLDAAGMLRQRPAPAPAGCGRTRPWALPRRHLSCKTEEKYGSAWSPTAGSVVKRGADRKTGTCPAEWL